MIITQGWWPIWWIRNSPLVTQLTVRRPAEETNLRWSSNVWMKLPISIPAPLSRTRSALNMDQHFPSPFAKSPSTSIRVIKPRSINFNHISCLVGRRKVLSDCGEPEIPANGEVTITTQSTYQEANYTCRYGYELRGQQTRTCYGRSWNGNQPTCMKSVDIINL